MVSRRSDKFKEEIGGGQLMQRLISSSSHITRSKKESGQVLISCPASAASTRLLLILENAGQDKVKSSRFG